MPQTRNRNLMGGSKGCEIFNEEEKDVCLCYQKDITKQEAVFTQETVFTSLMKAN